MITAALRRLKRYTLRNNEPCSPFLRDNRRFARYQIGEYTYGAPTVLSWGGDSNLIIGKFCSIAAGVQILLGGEHRIDWVTTYPFSVLFADAKEFIGHPRSKGDIRVGNDVWLAEQAMILSGVTIGDGAVVGARALITKDVPPYAIVAGNPARIVRYRFDEETIKALCRAAWWNWPLEKIKEAWPLLLSDDIQGFLAIAASKDSP